MQVEANNPAKAEISIIVIGRNEAPRIGACLRSVFASLPPGQNCEVLYIDSASEDETVAIASRFPVRILQLRSSWKLTPSAGRFIGYQHATGNYLLFVDGDSVIDEHWPEASRAFLRENPGYGGVAGIIQESHQLPNGADTNANQNGDRQAANLAVQVEGRLIGRCATYRRDAMQEAGTFNPYLPTGEECELGLRIRKAGYKLAHISVPMCRTYALPSDSLGEIMRRSRRHLYDYGATLRYCLWEGSGIGFCVEQMSFILTFVGFAIVFVALLVIGFAAKLTALWALVGAATLICLAIKRKRPTQLLMGALRRTMMTYHTVRSFLSTKVMPIESYPTDVIHVK
jgi:glycosyltransferase involved in cell wall biosynthesis